MTNPVLSAHHAGPGYAPGQDMLPGWLEKVTAKLALVDDDTDFTRQLARLLEREQLQVETYSSAAEFFAGLRAAPPDLVILDQMMPGMTGIEALRQLRAFSAVPCIMLTGSLDEATRIHGLEGGADDYIAKAAPPREILARIRIALRRPAAQPTAAAPAPPPAPNWKFSTTQRALYAPSGEAVPLTSSEFELLQLLQERAGQPVSREECCRRIFRRAYRAEDRAIDTLVAKLRSKIEIEPGRGRMIHALRGVGYVFVGFEPGIDDPHGRVPGAPGHD